MLSVNTAHAEVAAGIGFGYPGMMTLRAVAHPESSALGFQAEFSGWNQVSVLRLDARAANSFRSLRTVWFAGITNYSNALLNNITALYVEAGMIAELRFVPGIGFSVEAGPQYALSKSDSLSSFSFTASAGLVFWLDVW